MTDAEYDRFRKHIEEALEHMNIVVMWVFLSLVGAMCVRGKIDTVFDAMMAFMGGAAGGMAALNSMWGWRSLRQAHAIIKRDRS